MRQSRTARPSFKSLAAWITACSLAGSALAQQVTVPAPVEVAPQGAAPTAPPSPPPPVTLPAPSAAPAALDAGLPQAQGSGSIQWRCGGIGSDESTAMRAAMKAHPLSLLFARADGAYLADVQVDIRAEASGGVSQSLRASGPVCLLSLPPGRYVVDASLGGERKTQSVQVGGAPRTLDFRF
ncbi:carboxypeptidase regulatory-like domain-containing protein [Xenophilus arseniciresistens]|uniref:Carboxypeptidase regulatory-like domain-containing protein n=1 Tax=Xenophilus arseniciresistens TaxID=1283306 RepID=A0AAE3T1A6_9BURK|nr:carboxypeptidase regulatory-like domain-containing protein [Xenophilus arseniciresistens]MDA7418370.1 carboxypeptidase regulatory-like domain-containing protein [Xenophilus arseniciresistens]